MQYCVLIMVYSIIDYRCMPSIENNLIHEKNIQQYKQTHSSEVQVVTQLHKIKTRPFGLNVSV